MQYSGGARRNYGKAVAASEKALATAKEVAGENSCSYAAMLEDQAELLLGFGREARCSSCTDVAQERYRAAESALRRALQIFTRLYGEQSPEALDVLQTLGESLQRQNKGAEAEPLFRRHLQLVTQAFGADHWRAEESRRKLAELLDSIGKLAEAEALVRDPNAKCILRAELLPLRKEYTAARNGEEAIAASERALSAASKIDGEQSCTYATILADHATHLARARRPTEAERLHRRALELFTTLYGERSLEALNVLEALAWSFRWELKDVEAEPLFRRHFELAAAAFGPHHWRAEKSRGDLVALLRKLGKSQEAEALAAQQKGRGRPPETPPDEWGLLAREASRLNSFEIAQQALSLAERIWGTNHAGTIQSVRLLAKIYVETWRYEEAEPLYLRALEMSEGLVGSRDEAIALGRIELLGELGALYQKQGRYSDAEPLLVRALGLRKLAYSLTDEADVDAWLSRTLLSLLYKADGRYKEAESLTLEAMEALLASGGERESSAMLLLQENLASVYEKQGRYGEAEPLYRLVLQGYKSRWTGDHEETLNVIEALGRLYRRQGRYAEAEPLLVHAFTAFQRDLGRDTVDTVEAAAELALLRLEQPGKGMSALDPARFAISALRSRRAALATGAYGEAQGIRDQLQFGELYSLFADAAWVASEAGVEPRPSATAEAFTALQDATAGTTARAVVQMAVRNLADDADSELGALVRERERLNEQWTRLGRQYSAALGGNVSQEERKKLQQERSAIESRMEDVDAGLRKDFPQFFALMRPEPLDVAAAQEMLGPDEAVLMVVPTAFGTHVVAVSRAEIGWFRSNWTTDQVNKAVRRLLWDVGASVDVSPAQAAEWELQGGPGYPYDRNTAHALYREIVAPAAAILKRKRHVFIAASGSLSSLPFGILVTEQPQGRDGDPTALRATNWFADAHALIQIPSLQSLQFLRRYSSHRGSNNGSVSFVGFGDPVLEGQAIVRGRSRQPAAAPSRLRWTATRSGANVVDVAQLKQMARLPGTADELEKMRAALGAGIDAVFLRERATETNVRNTDLGNARIVALATHGLIAGELKGVAEPGLVFTPPAVPSEQDDGLLTASEVSGLRLDADWVILSACNTAAGDGSKGAPGLSGLARAFFYAGARNLLASHWPVRDDVATRLTVRAIQLQRETRGLSRAEALRQAMREMRDDASHDRGDDTWAHPSAWAPFTLIGDGAH